ncbi:restriction endonuclease subunit S [Leuconostoc mesenteroides]|uniref:restriction endonuclease subunit S n=1 Tax=Leuconostoc mesenteroides TaxID=1245 RepID=UPI0021140335|nr:restriction endonuclease subunit S [Leuconostoc mesenteroides]UUE17043.1 restriction endonuclease subunit S [Leuconostoc mesenteroides]
MTSKVLTDFTIGAGSYGIAASAVDKNELLPTYLRITDIYDDGTLNFEGLKSVDDPKSDNYKLEPNDIVFARTGGSTGRNYFYDGEDGDFIYAGFLIKFSIDPGKCNPKFIKYYCQSQEYKEWVQSFNTGSTRGNINAKTFGNMPIPYVSRKQQDLIVKTLSALDDKIAENKKINHHLEQIAMAIFDDIFPNVSSGDSKIGKYIVPKRGKGLLSKDAIDGVVPVIAGGLQPATYHNVANTMAPVITISASGANAGYVNLWSVPVWSSDSSFIDKSMTNDVYFWYIMLKKRQQEIYDSQTGSAQPHIYPKHIDAMPTNALSDELISSFTEQVTSMFEQIGNNLDEIKVLQDCRDALLPKLMSGELSVTD